MKKQNQAGFGHVLLIAAIVLLFGLIGLTYLAQSNAAKPGTSTPPTAPSTTGNGSPNGTHYNLNIIGVPQAKTADITSGNRIFVPLEGICKINLTPGDFSVLDGNCTNNGTAAFQLPNPDANGDGVTEYSVWAKPLGKPGGKSTATTCATDPTTNEQVCSLESTAFVRTKGKSTFTNITKDFLTISIDIDGDGKVDSIPIFDSRLQDYFWNYDNNGLKNLQLRFYQK